MGRFIPLREVRDEQRALERAYDACYAAADRLLKQQNTCDIHADEDGAVRCRDTRKRRGRDGENIYLCCRACSHLGPQGCTVTALSCKLWICSTATEAQPATAKKLMRLMRIAYDHGIVTLGYRLPKPAVIAMALQSWRRRPR